MNSQFNYWQVQDLTNNKIKKSCVAAESHDIGNYKILLKKYDEKKKENERLKKDKAVLKKKIEDYKKDIEVTKALNHKLQNIVIEKFEDQLSKRLHKKMMLLFVVFF